MKFSPSRFLSFWRLYFLMATILQLKVAKRRLFEKVSLERCSTNMIITEQLRKTNTKCKYLYANQQQQFLVVWQTLTLQYHDKHKLDGKCSCCHQEPEQSQNQGCHKDGLLGKTTRSYKRLHVRHLHYLLQFNLRDANKCVT